MSDNSNNLNDRYTPLKKQVLRLLDNTCTIIDLVSRLDDGILGAGNDVATQWVGKYSLYSIARAFLMMKLENWSESLIYDHLRQHTMSQNNSNSTVSLPDPRSTALSTVSDKQ